jgi:hypothetical protein
MSPKQRYSGLMERWPDRAQLYIRELPGFFWSAPDRDELIEFALDALDVHLAWLDFHGYPPALDNEGGLAVIEDLPSKGGVGPRFDSDLLELDHDEIENALSIGRVALSDIIDLADELEPRADVAAEVDRIVLHIAVQDIWFATRIDQRAPSLRLSPEPIDAMIAAAGLFEERIDAISAGIADDIAERDGEEWTLAKLLRRRTSHIREHALELAALGPGD